MPDSPELLYSKEPGTDVSITSATPVRSRNNKKKVQKPAAPAPEKKVIVQQDDEITLKYSFHPVGLGKKEQETVEHLSKGIPAELLNLNDLQVLRLLADRLHRQNQVLEQLVTVLSTPSSQ